MVGSHMLSKDFSRRIALPAAGVRRTLIASLEQQRFTVSRAQGGVVEAHRDVRSLMHARTPLQLSALVVDDDTTSLLHVHLAASSGMVGPVEALQRVYRPMFSEVEQQLDGAFPAATPDGPQPDDLVVRAGDTDDIGVRFDNDVESASMSAEELQMCISVASMAVATPGTFDDVTTDRLEQLMLDVRRGVDASQPPEAAVPVDAPTRDLVDLLYRQIEIRQQLPVRELERCRDCRNEKIINPDYAKLVKHNKRMQDWLGIFGVTVGQSSGINVFVAAGKLLEFRQMNPDFVCERCQGMKADLLLVTMCPQCGTITKDPILRSCASDACGFSYESLATSSLAWGVRPTPVVSPPAAQEAPYALAPVMELPEQPLAPPPWPPPLEPPQPPPLG